MRNSTLDKIAEFICGNDQYPRYRSSLDLTIFFRKAGLPQFVHDGSAKRQQWVLECLQACSKNELKAVLRRLAHPWEYDNDPEKLKTAITQLNLILEPEGMELKGEGPQAKLVRAAR